MKKYTNTRGETKLISDKAYSYYQTLIGKVVWNKGKTYPATTKMTLAGKKRRGISMPKPPGFSETMRRVNPPKGMKFRLSDLHRDFRNGKKEVVWRDQYVMVYKPEHPSSRKKPPDYGYILEHRYVMENHLERPLLKTELVHHVDGCKSNNKVENLIICSAKEHNAIHERMEILVEKLIREGKVYYDREKEEFLFR